jgi:hypothetical protein
MDILEDHPPVWSNTNDYQTFPSKMWCWEHQGYRRVAREGRVVQTNFDPTQTYVLECGHVVI